MGLSTEDNQTRTLEFPCPNPTPEKSLLVRAEVQAVWEAARSLSQQQRTIFALRFVEGLELNEIAEILGLQVGSVKSHLFRAVHELYVQHWYRDDSRVCPLPILQAGSSTHERGKARSLGLGHTVPAILCVLSVPMS